jgi:LPS sulfotransferase NodH
MTSLCFSGFVVLAEMRTGSNFLENNLNRIPGIKCHGEAFNPFFIGGEGKQEYLGLSLDDRRADPGMLLRAMKAATPGLSGFRYFHDHDPRVFDLVINDPAIAKIILTRNQLESYVSWKIAMQSDQWWLANTKHLTKTSAVFDLEEFRARLEALEAHQRRVVHRLQSTGQTAYYIDYADILDLDVLNGLAAFLGVEGRLEALDYRFKKQNPEAIEDKVANPQEMKAGLQTIDWFDVSHTPNYEPRRTAMVPQYVASRAAPVLFMPIKAAPEARLRKWLKCFGEIDTGLDRNLLRKWKETHPGQLSFTVLRHPLERAHVAWCDYLARDPMPELRPYLKRVHKLELPPRAQAGYGADQDGHRAGFLVFLDFVKHLLNGRTELRTLPTFGTQQAFINGFAGLQSPDHILREDRLEVGLKFLCDEVGLEMPALPKSEKETPFALTDLYGPDLEDAARAAYWRDYQGFGFGDWQAPG